MKELLLSTEIKMYIKIGALGALVTAASAPLAQRAERQSNSALQTIVEQGVVSMSRTESHSNTYCSRLSFGKSPMSVMYTPRKVYEHVKALCE
jgi:hypothetical protein